MNTPPVTSIFDLVDLPKLGAPAAPKKPADMAAAGALDELPPTWREAISTAGRRAYHGALAADQSAEQAATAGKFAAIAAFDKLAAEHGIPVERSAAPTPAAPPAIAPAPVVAPPPVVDLPTIPDLIAPPAPTPAPVVIEVAPVVAPAPKSTGKRGVEICEAGKLRSQRDVDTLTRAGFAMRTPLYARGTMVIDMGVENARESRAQYDGMPLVTDACGSLIHRIETENRRLVEVRARDVNMDPVTGRIQLGRWGHFDVTEKGFDGLVEMLGFGGAKYLRDNCPVDLRADNVNRQALLRIAAEDSKAAEQAAEKTKVSAPRELAARVRDRAPSEKAGVVDPGGPEIFAAVSTGYPTFDGDKIAEAFRRAMPADARGTVRYDPASTGTRFEALFHTTVAPEHFVAGEVFRTGIRVRANDSGDGSIVVRAIAFQNLCLNLIIIDRAGKEIARIPHVGTVHALQAEFAKALAKAAKAIEPFMRQWSQACGENLADRLKSEGVKLPEKDDEIMRGIFTGLMSARRVRFPRLIGKSRDAIIDDLVASWRGDVSSATARHGGVTRAAVVNAITNTAQQWVAAADPWATDGIELDAARLLWGHGMERPAPLAFVDPNAEEVELEELPAVGAASN